MASVSPSFRADWCATMPGAVMFSAAAMSTSGLRSSRLGVSNLAEEAEATSRGMRIAIPKDEWVVFHGMPPSELGGVLMDLARRVRPSEYRKQPRGPNRPKPEKASGYAKKHLSTAKLPNDKSF